MQSNNNIFTFDLNKFEIVDSTKFNNEIQGLGYHKNNLLFTSDNTLYYYDSNEKKISKQLTFDFDFNYSVITSTDSTIIMGCRNRVDNAKYNYYLVHLKIKDMEEYFNTDFYAMKDTVVIGDTVKFKSYFEYSNIHYMWDFGDGFTSNEKNPKHVYKNVGSFDVNLLLTNGKDTSITSKENYITVLQTSNVADYKNILSISPNPASDYIEISIKDVPHFESVAHLDIEIYDVLGEKIWKSTSVPSGHLRQRRTFRLNVTNLPTGTYFIKLGCGNTIKSDKFIISK